MAFDGIATSIDVAYYGCRFTWSGLGFSASFNMHGGSFSSYSGPSCFIGLYDSQAFYAYFSTTTTIEDSHLTTLVMAGGVYLDGESSISGLDFQGASSGLLGSSGTTIINDANTTSGSTYFLTVSVTSGSFLLVRNGAATVTGSTSGICAVLRNGSQALQIKAMCNGTLTNSAVPGDEITVGGFGTVSFSDLPMTDDGLGVNTQFCRAT
jgi:hypothetical protein